MENSSHFCVVMFHIAEGLEREFVAGTQSREKSVSISLRLHFRALLFETRSILEPRPLPSPRDRVLRALFLEILPLVQASRCEMNCTARHLEHQPNAKDATF